MTYDVNKIIEESVANIMDEPENKDGVIEEGLDAGKIDSKEGEDSLLDEGEFEASKKFLMESVSGELEGKKV